MHLGREFMSAETLVRVRKEKFRSNFKIAPSHIIEYRKLLKFFEYAFYFTRKGIFAAVTYNKRAGGTFKEGTEEHS